MGTQVTVSATVTQGDRSVVARYPMGAFWTGTGGVYVGTREQSDKDGGDYRAVFDPATGQLTALKPARSRSG